MSGKGAETNRAEQSRAEQSRALILVALHDASRLILKVGGLGACVPLATTRQLNLCASSNNQVKGRKAGE